MNGFRVEFALWSLNSEIGVGYVYTAMIFSISVASK